MGLDQFSVNYPYLIDTNDLPNILKEYTGKLFINLNKNIFNSEMPALTQTLEQLSHLNVQGVFFYDLAVLNITKRLNLNLNLIWAQNYLTTNYQTCAFYKKNAVQGVLLSNELTLNEIRALIKQTPMTYYMMGFGYVPIATSKRQLVSNYLTHIKKPYQEQIYFLNDEKSEQFYPIFEQNGWTTTMSSTVLNTFDELKNIKSELSYLIMNSFLIDDSGFKHIVDIYEKAISDDLSLKYLAKNREYIASICPNVSHNFLYQETIYRKTNPIYFFTNQETIYRVKKDEK